MLVLRLRGKDIYCAGISAVAQTTLLGLLKNLKTKIPDIILKKAGLQCKIPSGIRSGKIWKKPRLFFLLWRPECFPCRRLMVIL
jgi:hypothetical protein